jgi:hypothetical protein
VEKKELVMNANSTEPPAGQEPKKTAKPPVRYATKEEFEKADRKVSVLHAGLFRRLAK